MSKLHKLDHIPELVRQICGSYDHVGTFETGVKLLTEARDRWLQEERQTSGFLRATLEKVTSAHEVPAGPKVEDELVATQLKLKNCEAALAALTKGRTEPAELTEAKHQVLGIALLIGCQADFLSRHPQFKDMVVTRDLEAAHQHWLRAAALAYFQTLECAAG